MSENTDRNGSRHTPGPWIVRQTTVHGRPFGGLWVEAIDPDDIRGERLIPMTGSGGARSYTLRVVDIQDHDDNDANARLIAAAPDMFEALKEAREQVETLQARLGIKDYGHGTLSIIDAALSKAHHPTSQEREPSA